MPAEKLSSVNSESSFLTKAGAYAPLIILFCSVVLIGSLSRLLLVLWQLDRVWETGILPTVFLQGLRVDLILAGMAVAPLLLVLPVLGHRYTWSAWKKLTAFWAVLAITLVVFMELATPTFIGQYDVRPNRLFIEYLKFPREVFSMLWTGFKPTVFLSIGFTAGAIALFWRALRPWLRAPAPSSHKKALLVWPLVVLAVFMCVRSTTGHRPANPAMFALTSDPLVNSLIINSTWSVSFAIYNLKHETENNQSYGSITDEAMLNEVTTAPWLAGYQFSSEHYPTMHHQTPGTEKAVPLNLVIVLEESLGATFVESLGGWPVTPRLEALKSDGWWFENLYATGTRSVRGIEAVISGFLPSASRSVVKLSLSQSHFFTLAGLLERNGYNTGFIYGGEAHFDNMRSFFSGNGFQHISDQGDYANPNFIGSWGVSDEDLFNKTNEELEKLHRSGQPFFRLVFSSSNHTPFEFPDGRISLYDRDKNTVNNAVKYADHALGEFIETARQQDYWKNTVFLIVADHDARVWGDELVPIKNFHIPGLILGGEIEPKRVSTIASQIDLAPTLLSLMGLETDHPMIGRDITRDPDAPGRAMMQFNDYYAWMGSDHRVTVLRPDRAPLDGLYNPVSGKTDYLNTPPSDARFQRALAFAQLPLWLYREQKYDLPQKD
ncbi:LTA synthase family protein [Marinobacter alexandrii]|jgi:phosphoglycerol transferase MdoB-like AlkP superfamily enzyme|uniref:LTA synthase family protein n=1 Tax=Marinobacter alexandrii TaxID=2570351 RepID=UPI002ABE0406|nr:LTA synthase family protein [Marinobacter alexandrii]